MIAWRLEQYDALASTSDSCILRAKDGAAEGLAILALRQTAGRGSRGRQWQAPTGNLNLSVLLRPALSMAQSSIFPLLTGVAVADAVAAFLPADTAPVLKWPNDVLLGGAKLAGILIDAAPKGNSADWLVIGIGINLAEAPELPGRRTTTLAQFGGHAKPPEAAQMVLHYLAFWLDVLESFRRCPHPRCLAAARPPDRHRAQIDRHCGPGKRPFRRSLGNRGIAVKRRKSYRAVLYG